MIVLGTAVYRALGLPLVVVASVFVLYVFFGHSELLPDAIRWKGASFGKAMWHYWIQTEGVFGVALGVSASMIFLFVLFGAILEKAGAGNYFIKLSFSLLGHFRGGPAKAAVVASAMSGIYSGSSIANTVTTGTFTIPLMKRTGFSAEKAGAVEVASSTNGQLTPPVMGAAAFLISEFTGVSYPEIIKHALVPAVASYIALVYIVHLEAMKLDLKGLPRPPSMMPFAHKVIGFLSGFIGIAVLGLAVYYGLGWIKVVTPDFAFAAVAVLCAGIYLVLLWLASRIPDLVVDALDAPITELPRPGPTALSGLFYLLPIVILIWCIMLERLSPALSAFWASVAMIVVSLTQHPLKAWMRGAGGAADDSGGGIARSVDLAGAFRRGAREWFEGMVSGARNMIGIGVATGAAGVIVGTISLTGAHQVVGEFVEFLSGGNLMLMLVLVAIMSLILGMGLPTTANYIVVSSLMAPVIVALGAKSGLIVPLVAVHLFVFYFGILADDTPPVGLAAFAAAAISGGDPIRTGVQGFMYDIRTAILPFLFLFNTELLLIGRDGLEGRLRVPDRGGRDDALRGGDPGVFLRAQPGLGIAAVVARGVHPVPARILAGPGLGSVRAAAGHRSARRRRGRGIGRGAAPHRRRTGFQRPRYRDRYRHHRTARSSGQKRRLHWRRRRAPGEGRVAAADRGREGQAGGAATRISIREPGPDLRFLRRRACRDRIARAAARTDAKRSLLPAGDSRHRSGDLDATAASTLPALRTAATEHVLT